MITAKKWEPVMGPIHPKPVKIFYSYASEDESLLYQLDTHLSVMKQQWKISTWCDRDVQPGESIKEAIVSNLADTDLFLLLISSYFFHSKKCLEEMRYALDRKQIGNARLVPIILHPCDWENAPPDWYSPSTSA